jgi:hypothetical protein
MPPSQVRSPRISRLSSNASECSAETTNHFNRKTLSLRNRLFSAGQSRTPGTKQLARCTGIKCEPNRSLEVPAFHTGHIRPALFDTG